MGCLLAERIPVAEMSEFGAGLDYDYARHTDNNGIYSPAQNFCCLLVDGAERQWHCIVATQGITGDPSSLARKIARRALPKI